MEKVIIYIPTYRNEHIFSLVLDSYLRQTYKNIEVRVFDNSLADGSDCIQRICTQKSDPRVAYFSNKSQIGAQGNICRILNCIDFDSLAIVLASDMALADHAVEDLISLRASTGSSVIMPATRNYNSLLLNKYSGRDFFDQPFESLQPLTESVSKFSSCDILKRYFSYENLTGEFFRFSVCGCLFDGALSAGMARNYTRFKFHGGEQYLSMSLLIRAGSVTYSPSELLWNFYGHQRIGGTQRSNSDIGRMECIQACQMVLEENEFFLLAEGVDVNEMRVNQVEKAVYFKKHFRGFDKYADDIIQRNRFFIE
jgi:glycosyltransferase involved in cell wall biosynthesis